MYCANFALGLSKITLIMILPKTFRFEPLDYNTSVRKRVRHCLRTDSCGYQIVLEDPAYPAVGL